MSRGLASKSVEVTVRVITVVHTSSPEALAAVMKNHHVVSGTTNVLVAQFGVGVGEWGGGRSLGDREQKA